MKFHKKYIPLLNPEVRKKHNIRYVILTGGRGSGKSTAGAHFLHDVSFDTDNVAIHSRFTMTSAKISVISEITDAINKRNSQAFFYQIDNQVVNKVSKGFIHFKGLKTGSLNQTAALKSVTNLNIWYLDEAEELHDESVFDDVDESIRRQDYENLIILSLNTYRIDKEHFIYQRFFNEQNIPDYYNGIKGNTLYIHTSYLDNLDNLDQSFLNIIEEAKKKYGKKEIALYLKRGYIKKGDYFYDPKKKEFIYSEKYQYRYLGRFRKRAEGVVFDEWETYKNEPEDYDEIFYAGDFGFTNDPTTAVQVKVDYKKKKAYIKELLYEHGLLNSVIAKRLIPIIGDEWIIFDSAEPKSIVSLRNEYGLNALGAVKGADSIRAGVELMKEWELLIHHESGHIIFEFNNYCYDPKSKDVNKPVKKHDHTIDPIRYIFLKNKL